MISVIIWLWWLDFLFLNQLWFSNRFCGDTCTDEGSNVPSVVLGNSKLWCFFHLALVPVHNLVQFSFLCLSSTALCYEFPPTVPTYYVVHSVCLHILDAFLLHVSSDMIWYYFECSLFLSSGVSITCFLGIRNTGFPGSIIFVPRYEIMMTIVGVS